MAGHVYLIGSPKFRWYKIGKSSDATIRIVDLGLLLPFRIEVIAVTRLQAYVHLEGFLHRKYAQCRVNGEWFSFNDAKLRDVIEDMELMGVPTTAMIGFKNIERDVAHDGRFMVVEFKKNEPLTLPLEERERRKEAAIAKKKAEGWVPLTAEERLFRKNRAIAERAERQKLRGPRYFFLDNRATG
jgi:hypothetical protein